ncbi:HlyD family efflux transporter periplasmic adaptor subunit [Gallaecimonas pentaromativorans]|uniref:HlyD family efflux transporter periplasmic adaptor subunit n=1 Tax=Gallaecimonas pentaromativorans TaxID=584787 RepID=UPI003A90929E
MTEQDNNKPPQQTSPTKRRVVLAIIALVFILAGGAWYAYDKLVLAYQEETDDAYVTGDQVSISSRSNGTVIAVMADSTDLVKKGQVLVSLDPVDTELALARAEGQLSQAVRQAQQQIAQAAEADAAVAQSEAAYVRAEEDYQRRKPLLAERAAAKENVDAARRQMEAAKAAFEQAKASARAAHVAVDGMAVARFPAVQQAEAAYVSAWIDNKRREIRSPIDGYVAKRQVQAGQHIQAGQNLMTVVPLHNAWIEANFKETQIAHIRVGQPVTLKVDAHSDMTYHGKVVGLTAGTGSVFSLLPAQNATGNWIKVIQRLPVRIAIDPQELAQKPLQLGLSTLVTIDTHDRNGSALPQQPADKEVMSTDIYQGQQAAARADAQAIINANLVAR